MADQPGADGERADRVPATDLTTGTPRWVKVFAIVGVVVVLLIVVMLLTGHGPGRHMHGGLGRVVPATAPVVTLLEGV